MLPKCFSCEPITDKEQAIEWIQSGMWKASTEPFTSFVNPEIAAELSIFISPEVLSTITVGEITGHVIVEEEVVETESTLRAEPLDYAFAKSELEKFMRAQTEPLPLRAIREYFNVTFGIEITNPQWNRLNKMVPGLTFVGERHTARWLIK